MSTGRGNGEGGGPVRYAVVGLGGIAQEAILPAFANADNSEVVALVSGSEDKRAEVAARYGIETHVDYADYDDLLARGDVDAVYITVPNHLHCDFTVRAAQAGIHVLCEKPMAVTTDECRQMIAACREHDVRLMVAYRLHFERANLEVAELVRRGDLGETRLFESVFTQQVPEGDIRLYPIEKGGGGVYDLGVYCINAARYLFRAEPYEVYATMVQPEGDPRFAEADEMTSVVMRFPDDRLASFITSQGAAPVNAYRVVGTEGTVTVEPAYDYQTQLTYEVEAEGRRWEHEHEPRDQFGPELVYFSDCILEGREPEPSGLEGLIDVQIVEAIYESARSGRPVRLELERPERRPSAEQIITRPEVEPPQA